MPPLRVVCVVVAISVGGGLAGIPASAVTPAANVGMPVDFWLACDLDATSPACVDAVVADIDHARSLEGVGPMVLPTGFGSLDPGRQAFVVTNLERVDRGLRPILGLTADLDALAAAAASAGTDPVFTGTSVGPMRGVWWTGIWAAAPTPLVADLLWMYQDGYGGSDTTNIDCTSVDGSGCWGHRANILSSYGGAQEIVAGTGFAAGGQSLAELAVGGSGPLPALVYTWAQAVTAGADGAARAAVVSHAARKHHRRHRHRARRHPLRAALR